MSDRKLTGHRGLRILGSLSPPGDKSIAHRVLLLGSLARGTTYAKSVPQSTDIEATMRALRLLGVRCERAGDAVSVVGLGHEKYAIPQGPIDCGGSATTFRLLLGALAGRGQGRVTLTGDEFLRSRPMDRVARPLGQMGALIEGCPDRCRPPVTINCPTILSPTDYELPVASAQVKTAILLAGLSAEGGRTVVRGAIHSRDHTERLIPRFGGSLVVTDNAIMVEPGGLSGVAVGVPGDASSAAFMAACAAGLESSRITLRGVNTNPTRTGFFEALSWMGCDVIIEDTDTSEGEPVGDISVRWSPLKGIEVPAEAVPYLIDEVPLLMLLGCLAEGDTVLRGLSELRLKESDRVSCAVEGLTRMGADIEVGEEVVTVGGSARLRGAELDPWGDHRMSMMFTIAALCATGDSLVRGVECEKKSFPAFYSQLQQALH